MYPASQARESFAAAIGAFEVHSKAVGGQSYVDRFLLGNEPTQPMTAHTHKLELQTEATPGKGQR